MKIRKSFAGVAAGSLALAGMAVVTAPAAQANTTTYAGGIFCRVNNTALSSATNDGAGTITLTVSPASASPSATVTITASTLVADGGNAWSPNNGPAVSIAAGTQRMEVNALFNGSPVVLTGAANAAIVATNADIFPAGFSASGTATAPVSNGTYNVTVTKLVVNGFTGGTSTPAQTDPFDSVCGADVTGYTGGTPASDATQPSGFTGLFAAVDVDARLVTVNATSGQTTANYGRAAGSYDPDGPGPAPAVPFAGQTVTLGVNNAWGAGSASVELCDAASTVLGCQAVGTVVLTGATAETVTVVLPAGLTTGLRNLVVTDPVDNTKKRTAAYNVLGGRTLARTPANGGPGTTVSASGSNWNTGETVALGGLTALFAPTADSSSATAGATGSFAGTIVVNAATTAYITATSIAQAPQGASQSFQVNEFTCNSPSAPGIDGVWNTADDVLAGAGCTTKQNVTATVNAGLLKQTAYAHNGGWNTTFAGGGTTGVAANYFNLTVTGGAGTGLQAGAVRVGGGVLVTAYIANGGSGYLAGDIVTIAAGATGAGSTAITITLVSSNGYTNTLIPFGAVTSSVAGSTIARNLNPITVEDARGSLYGWTLSASVTTPLTAVDGTIIASSNLALSAGNCLASAAGSATSGITNGSAFNLAGSVMLCSKDSTTAGSAGSTSSGQYLITKGLTLTVPGFQKAGNYSGTVTVLLV